MEEEINYNMLMTKELYEMYNKLNEEFKAAQDSLKEQYLIMVQNSQKEKYFIIVQTSKKAVKIKEIIEKREGKKI